MRRRQRDVAVKSYTSERSMRRGIERMAELGYDPTSTTGEFSRFPGFGPRWRKRKVTVTYRRMVSV